LDYQIQRGEDWHNVVRVTFPAATVKPELEAKYAELKNIRIEGFRKGKVPAQLIKKMYGKQAEADAFRPFISEAYKAIFTEDAFDLLSSPELHHLAYDDETGLSFEFQFDVRPNITVQKYKGLAVERLVLAVTEEDVDRTLENMRRQNAMVHNVEEGAQTGHFVIADLQELDPSGVPILGRRLEDRVLELAEGEEITAQLLGIKAGEERRVQLTVEQPPDSQIVQSKPNSQVFYSVSAKEVKERRLPSLDDEFAKDMGQFENMAALRQAILQRLQVQAQTDTADHFHRALEDELIKANPLQPPPSMVENYLQAVMEDARKRSKAPLEEEMLRRSFRPMVIRNLSWILLREQLIKDQAITTSEEEVEARLALIAAGGPQAEKRAQDLRNNQEALQRLKDAMLEGKVYELLAREALISENHQSWSQHQAEHAEGNQAQNESEE